uniref:Thyroid transcription factor 1-associated protein 26 n=2 Tax=Cyprinus carpio TaxID=7962 RepID=A0A8C1S601_CYPCA
NMEPLKQNAKTKGPIKGKYFNNKCAHGGLTHNDKKKRKWVPENKVFDGSLKEGEKKMQASPIQLEEEYPEHLRHLYLTEKERLDEEEQEKKKKRCKGRTLDEETEADDELKTVLDLPFTEKHISNTTTDQTTVSDSDDEPAETDRDSNRYSHKTPFIQRKQKMSSYQKTKQEYERIKEERARKQEEFLKDEAQREEALKIYKEKKMATYQLLKRKTKKGQLNLNLHMELLLQKIQAQHK